MTAAAAHRSTSIVLVSILLLVRPAAAGELGPGSSAEVTGDHVNLRTDARVTSTRVGQVSQGERVRVVRTVGSWCQIEPPASLPTYIHRDYVKITGDEGTITGSSVRVRTAASLDGVVLGQVNRGDRVQVLGRDGDWVQTAGVPGVTVWIHGQFLRPAGEPLAAPAGAAPSAAPIHLVAAPVAPAVNPAAAELARRADVLYEAAVSTGSRYWDFTQAEALYRRAGELAVDPALRARIESRLVDIRLRGDWQQERNSLESRLAQGTRELEEACDNLAREYEQRLEELRQQNAEDPLDLSRFVATGWLRSVGPIVRRPGSHRLVESAQTLYYLNAPGLDLDADALWGRYVGVVGTVREARGWNAPVIDVTEIQALEAPAGSAR